jgi:hypothetical protein
LADATGASARPTGLGTRLWQFANSPFALFLFSSVIIALVGQAYTRYEIEIKNYEDEEREIQALLLELDNRYTELNYIGDTNISSGRARIVDIIHGDGKYEPSSPKFSKISLATILAKTDLAFGDRESEATMLLPMEDVEDDANVSVGSAKSGAETLLSRAEAGPSLYSEVSPADLARESRHGVWDIGDYTRVRELQYTSCLSVERNGFLQSLFSPVDDRICYYRQLRPASRLDILQHELSPYLKKLCGRSMADELAQVQPTRTAPVAQSAPVPATTIPELTASSVLARFPSSTRCLDRYFRQPEGN